MGRKKLAPEERRSAVLFTTLTPSEHEQVRRQAMAEGLTLSSKSRRMILREFMNIHQSVRGKTIMSAKKAIISEQQAKTAFERIQKGTSTVIKEATALGHSNRIALRTAIVALVGQQKYKAAAKKQQAPAKKQKTERVSSAKAED